MDLFKLEKCNSNLLDDFPEIFEFEFKKHKRIQLGSLRQHLNPGIEISFIKAGKYDWAIEQKHHTLYPGNIFVTTPWQYHGSADGFIDLGNIYRIVILPEVFDITGALRLSGSICNDKDLVNTIGKTLATCKYPIIKNGLAIGKILEELSNEILIRPFGYVNKVYLLLNDLLLSVARGLLAETGTETAHDFDLKSLDTAIKQNLDHDWTVKELAQLVNRGVTSFTAIIKKKTGYTPLNYVIHLRIMAAKNMLLTGDTKIIDVAWKCGFSSSQHFSNTFKQRTGICPSVYKSVQL